MIHQEPLKRRVENHIRNYTLSDLCRTEELKNWLILLEEGFGMEYLLVSRHGEPVAHSMGFRGVEPDVVNEPGIKIRIQQRTIAHLYVDTGKVLPEKLEIVNKSIKSFTALIEDYAYRAYLLEEYSDYLEETEKEKESLPFGEREKKDSLTGLLSKSYFKKRMEIIDRSGIAPVALIDGNINDWKFVYDRFGEEECDRLVQIVAELISSFAKPEYVIGRCEEDVFHIMIPMPETGEAENFCKQIQASAQVYEDPILAPSIAFGIAYKENVEESLEQVLSDAEYEMLNDKMMQKAILGYQERLHKGC